MAVKTRFVHFNTRSGFNSKIPHPELNSANGNDYFNYIVFIKETQEIYTHGKFYNCSGYDDSEILQKINELSDKINAKQDLLKESDFITINDQPIFGSNVEGITIKEADHFANIPTSTGSGIVDSVEFNEHGHITKVSKKSLTSTDIPALDASKIASGTISIDRLPAGALERMFVVTSETAAMSADVQDGDVVQVTGNDNKMYFCVDYTATTFTSRFREFTAGAATSVPWSGITGMPDLVTQEELDVVDTKFTDYLPLSGGTVNGSITATSFIGDLTGNADSATKLATARTIWGQRFDGTGDINGNLAVNGGTIGYDATNKIWNLSDSLNVGQALTVRNKLTVDMSGYGNSQIEMKTNAGKSTLIYVKDFDWRFCNDDWSVMHKILHSGNLKDYKLSQLTDDIVSGNYLPVSNVLHTGSLNDYTTAGIYRFNVISDASAGMTNYGNLLVVRGGTNDTLTQLYFNYSDGKAFIRSGNLSGLPSAPWNQFAFISDIPTNYLPLSGGTVNGILSVASVLRMSDVDGTYKIILQRDSSGNILFGGGFAANNMYIDADVLRIRANETIFSREVTATDFITTSDNRLKDFTTDVDVDFGALKNIPKKYYYWKDKSMGYDLQIGTSAQELMKVYPECVHYDESLDRYSVNYQKLSIIALAAIDKLHDRVVELEKKLHD